MLSQQMSFNNKNTNANIVSQSQTQNSQIMSLNPRTVDPYSSSHMPSLLNNEEKSSSGHDKYDNDNKNMNSTQLTNMEEQEEEDNVPMTFYQFPNISKTKATNISNSIQSQITQQSNEVVMKSESNTPQVTMTPDIAMTEHSQLTSASLSINQSEDNVNNNDDTNDNSEHKQNKNEMYDEINANNNKVNKDEDEEEEEEIELQPYDFSKLPFYACSYCGIHSPNCVVRCDQCNKWFCNSRQNTSGTHIIHHLVRSKHKQISLHDDCPVGETSLECYNCASRNVFLLGFVPSIDEGVVVLLCRECLYLPNLRELNWDPEAWQPLIRDRELLDWMVRTPENNELSCARVLSTSQMNKLEEIWKINENAKYEDLQINNLLQDDKLEPVRITYDDGKQFRDIYTPLVQLEAEYDRNMKQAQKQEEVQLRWELSLGKRLIAYIRLNRTRGEMELRVVPGDELRITYPGDKNRYDEWTGTGNVVKIDDMNEEIMIELRQNVDKEHVPFEQNTGYIVEFVWKSTSFDRMNAAMKTLYTDKYSVTAYLYHLLMGHEVVPQKIPVDIPDDVSVPGLPQLNHSQIDAIKHCLQEPLSLIQGPPGTGKTVTAASIVYHLARQGQGQVLVAAPSNIAVDQLTYKIHQTGLKVVRLAAKSREVVSSDVDFLCLHNLVIQVAKIEKNELFKWYRLKADFQELKPEDEERYRRLVHETEKKLLQSADVICVTCVGAGDKRLKDFSFKQVLIDESTQATEPECLIPVVMGAKQLVLIGDHCQLGPVVMCKEAAKAGLGRSLFERLILLHIKPIRLQVQYRMHPSLSEFSSNTFYEGSLQNGVTKEDRYLEILNAFWPNTQIPMFFFCSIGREEFSASGTSYLNRMEATNVEKMITNLIQKGIKADQIGVITPYEGQRQYITSYMQRKGTLRSGVYDHIEIASVDAFQGREKDIIILSCVRSNSKQGIGFLNDPRRLNVALTRAKYGIIIVGNPSVLSRQLLWNNLLAHYKQNGLLVEGSLSSLKQSMIQLSQPRKYVNNELTILSIMPSLEDDKAFDNKKHNINNFNSANNKNDDFSINASASIPASGPASVSTPTSSARHHVAVMGYNRQNTRKHNNIQNEDDNNYYNENHRNSNRNNNNNNNEMGDTQSFEDRDNEPLYMNSQSQPHSQSHYSIQSQSQMQSLSLKPTQYYYPGSITDEHLEMEEKNNNNPNKNDNNNNRNNTKNINNKNDKNKLNNNTLQSLASQQILTQPVSLDDDLMSHFDRLNLYTQHSPK